MSQEEGMGTENRKGPLFSWVGLIISLVIIFVLVVILIGTMFGNQTQAATVALIIVGTFLVIAAVAWAINTLQRRKRRRKRLDDFEAARDS